MICPDCGHNNRVGVMVCDKCGADLYESLLEKVATKQLSRMQTREFNSDGTASSTSNPLVMYVTGYEQPVAIERKNALVVGRGGRESDGVDVDLTDYGAQDMGVSRRHARFDAQANPPMLTDLNSTNGVFVNGTKISANQAYVLRSGDEVKFGRLLVRVYFK
jgi:pSer/pThr/pTyr-binding forkhead associated (FHA) protein